MIKTKFDNCPQVVKLAEVLDQTFRPVSVQNTIFFLKMFESNTKMLEPVHVFSELRVTH